MKHSLWTLALLAMLMIDFANPVQAQPACTSDADCTDPSLPKCNDTTGVCEAVNVGCFSDTDCQNPQFPQCNLITNACQALQDRMLSIDGTGSGNGSTAGTAPSTISCTSTAGADAGTCSETVTDGTMVVLTATASAGSVFTGWSSCDSVASNDCTQTVSGDDETVMPNFELNRTPVPAMGGWGLWGLLMLGVLMLLAASFRVHRR